MPNQVTSTGLQIKTVQEILDSIINNLEIIYGSDINVDQNSPDGQNLNIYAQALIDQLQLLVLVYNSFDPDTVFGVLEDQRFALNGLVRGAGTYTITPVDVTVDRALTLNGLDALITDPNAEVFTVSDNAGNQFFLQESHTFSGGGSESLNFRAAVIGQVQTTVDTIDNVDTPVLGVTSVNNSLPATTVGLNEESDTAFKLRHSKSFLLAATGPADAVGAAIGAVPNVAAFFVAENDTGGTVDDVPANSIWCIVDGGADSDIAQAIYSKKAPGCGMKGSVSVDVARPAGNTFTAKFDRPIQQLLYMKMTLEPRRAGVTFDTDLIKSQLVAAIVYNIAQQSTIGDIFDAMRVISPDALLSVVGVSDDGITYVDILSTSDFQHKFVLDVSRIAITV